MAYGIKVREEVLRDLKNGLSVGKVSLKYGISISTIYKWKNSENIIEKPIEVEETENKQDPFLKEIPQKTAIEDEKEELSQKELNELIQKVKSLKNQNALEEALEACNTPLTESSNIIQSQKVSILIKLGSRGAYSKRKKYLEQALKICQRYDGKQNFLVGQKSKIEDLLSVYNKKEEMKRPSNRNLEQLATKIYSNCIEEEEIRNAPIEPWEKDILLIAYYEKYDKPKGIEFIKKLKKEYQEEPDKIKTLNQLFSRMCVKKTTLFDIEVYTSKLQCRVNFQLIPLLQEEYEQKERIKMKEQAKKVAMTPVAETKAIELPQKPSNTPSDKPERKRIVVEGQRITPRYSQSMNTTAAEASANQELLIKDVFAKELFQIGRELYVQLSVPENRVRGVKAWDRLERLKEKSYNDIDALRDMLTIISDLNFISPGFIKTNEKRNEKMYKELEEKEQKIKKYGTNN